MSWNESNTILYRLGKPKSKGAPIVSFDMDHTLIKPKDGRKFPQNKKDWEWYINNPNLKKYIGCLSDKGYHIIIFSNQSGISSGKTDKVDITEKIDDIIKQLDINNNISVFIATKSDIYRKPSKLIMDFAIKSLDITLGNNSFYCGDAAGRLKHGNIKKDFSCSDRKFASNCNLAFFTPEELFEIDEIDSRKWEWGSVNPKELLKEYSTTSNKDYIKRPNYQELVIMIGSPASGKSTISKNILKSNDKYKIVNQDELKTKTKCLNACIKYLNDGYSVILDRTNPKLNERKEFINLANRVGCKVNCIWVNTSPEMCEHLNMYRSHITKGEREPVPIIAMRIYRKNLEEPQLKEGYDNIDIIKPKIELKNEHERDLFLQWY